MPAHISHEIFAREALRRGVGQVAETIIQNHQPFLVLGAQGPDLFLHNHRTRPRALIFGKLLHSDSYGSFCAHLARRSVDSGAGLNSERFAYFAGFLTHAVLDRYAHPFINYFAGWVERGNDESRQFAFCHPFLERIIDVYVLQVRTGTAIDGYDFLSHIDLGGEIPSWLLSDLASAIEATYPEYDDQELIRTRIRNAFHDTRGYYRFTNPPDIGNLVSALADARRSDGSLLRLPALFHPRRLPDLDYLNADHRRWNHPGDAAETHTESFFDLYTTALEPAGAALAEAARAWRGERPLDDISTIVGNENLSDGRARRARRRLSLVDPLPLHDVLVTLSSMLRETGP